MATTPQQIDLWRQSRSEHQRLEFKEAKMRFDNQRLFKYCVALANEGGGFLVLGVADKPPRPVVGTQAFSNPVAMAEKLFEAVGFRVDIEEVAHPDGRVLVFHIPSRPRGTAYHLGGAYLMRSGEELLPMSEDQLRKIFAEGGPDWGEEHSVTGLDGQSVIERLDTQTYFELLKHPYPTDRAGVIYRLKQDRLIDGYQSRNERLADFMRRMGICEEKSSGIDRVINAAEVFQLPGPDFRSAHRRTIVIIFGPGDFENMDRNDRIRACYQHCALKRVMSERMTNQTLRQRFHLPESKSAIVSQVIAATIEVGLVKPDEKASGSKKFARYLPFWA